MRWNWEDAKLWIKRQFSTEPFKGDCPTVGKYNFPQLAQVNYLSELPVFPFNHLKTKVTEGCYWYHCFTAEKNFHRLYKNFREYEEFFPKIKGLISADFNMYRNYDEKILIDNCLKNRMVDYALQQAGVPMIPTAGFAGESTWEWCFDGLPKNSTVAVTTNTLYDKESNRLFIGGINAIVEKLQPTAIVVCGKCPEWIAKKFPDIQVIKIPNYVEMVNAARRKK